MREQIAFSLTPGFQSFMTNLSTLDTAASIIHGVIIELHPVWRWIIDYQRATGSFDELPDRIWPVHPEQLMRGPYYPAKEDIVGPTHRWNDFCVRNKKTPDDPFLVRVWVLPTTQQTLSLRRAVENYVQTYSRQFRFFAVVEDRPMASLATNVDGGNEITVTRTGSLGGFLKDGSGDKWGVTCGHVAQTVGDSVTLEDIGGVQYVGAGSVSHTTFPPPASSQTGI